MKAPIMIVLILLVTTSHAGQQIQTDLSSKKVTSAGTAFNHVIAASSKYKDCNVYEKHYRTEMEKPIGIVERQLTSVWGDLFLCLCRTDTKPSGQSFAVISPAYAEETACKLSTTDKAYGPYTNLVKKINEGEEENPPLAGMLSWMNCTRSRINGELSTDAGFDKCLSGK